MKILFFTQNYPIDYNEAVVSGMVKNPFYLSQALGREGHDTTVISSGDKRGLWNFDGVDVYCIGRGVFKGVVHAFVMEMKMLIKLLQIRKEKDFDVIHIHHVNILPIFLLRKLNLIHCPIIYTAHGTSTPELKSSRHGNRIKYFLLGINGKIQHFIDRLCWKFADKLISPSKFQIREMVDLYGVPEDKVSAIYNGVDDSRYFEDKKQGESLRGELGVPQDAPVVLCVARIARKKGIHILLKSAQVVIKKIPNVKFICVLGNMGWQLDYKKEILRLVKSEGLEKAVIIKESVTEKDLPSYYNSADVCVFPSTGYESIPTVIYEAMACGKPVITSKSWGIIEVLEEILLPEESLTGERLGKEIYRALEDKELQERLKKENLRKVEEFYWPILAQKHIELYEREIEK